ncbi:hypothetical protein ACHAQA_001519 [Verticillium albo-atrum]
MDPTLSPEIHFTTDFEPSTDPTPVSISIPPRAHYLPEGVIPPAPSYDALSTKNADSPPKYYQTNASPDCPLPWDKLTSALTLASSVPHSLISLPLTAPPLTTSDSRRETLVAHSSCKIIIWSFFSVLKPLNGPVVREFIVRGLVSPDVTSDSGQTPLLAAVSVGDDSLVRMLIALGATVDKYGTFDAAQRTPLQAAAADGRLSLVKLLREDFGADDGLLAPDGQIALRLAAKGKHKHVVAYLPARRLGAGRRLKAVFQGEGETVKTNISDGVKWPLALAGIVLKQTLGGGPGVATFADQQDPSSSFPRRFCAGVWDVLIRVARHMEVDLLGALVYRLFDHQGMQE